jgi:hypothetical protein
MKQKNGTNKLSSEKGLKGSRSEIIAAAHLVEIGYYVFSPVVHQQGPIDLIAINQQGHILLIDVKTDGKRINTGRKHPSRIYRIRTPLQKKLNVVLAYVNEDNEVSFVPGLEADE